MFVENKYKKWYNQLIGKVRSRKFIKGQHEKHHILPVSLGGNNKNSNIAYLTPREHYIAHLLLVKFTTGQNKSKMVFALFRFSPKGSKKYGNTRKYELACRMASKAMTGEDNPFYGKKHSKESLEKISGKNHGMYGTSCYEIWLERFGVEIADEKKRKMNEKRANSLKGEKHHFYGTKRAWVNKNGQRKTILVEELNQYLDDGWERGKNAVVVTPRRSFRRNADV